MSVEQRRAHVLCGCDCAAFWQKMMLRLTCKGGELLMMSSVGASSAAMVSCSLHVYKQQYSSPFTS